MTTQDRLAERIERSVHAREAAQALVQSAREAARRAEEDRARARPARAEHSRQRERRMPPAPVSADPGRIDGSRFRGRVVSTSLPQG